MKKCHLCGKPLLIRLMPDFTASGMWCSYCGVCFSDPQETFPFIPRGLVALIQGWNDFWDLASSYNEHIGVEAFDKSINDMGEELARQLSKYCDCWFDAKASKIFLLKIESEPE